MRDLPTYLFWDTDSDTLDFNAHKMQVISRVIGYRSMEDWKIIREVYPVETIEKIVTNLRCRYDVTFSFMAHF